MTTTVNAAFNTFLSSEVNLAKEQSDKARKSRDFLKGKIANFDDFFPLYGEMNIDFGSFARRTKIRPLDDIDMIFTLRAHGCTWEENFLDGKVYINTPEESPDLPHSKNNLAGIIIVKAQCGKITQKNSRLSMVFQSPLQLDSSVQPNTF